MRYLLCAHVLLCCLGVARSFCPSQCTCVYHGRSDGTGTRSVLCNDPDMSDIPINVPVDTVKLRVEKTAIRRIPTEAFYYLSELRYLWITYNSVSSVDSGSFYNLKFLHELRLDGNVLATFPWESLKEMPSLRTLDLHNNRLTSMPVEAAHYLVNITYLDLSSNKLTTLPSDLMDIWPPFNGVMVPSSVSQKVVLGLQDNPWFCDCRISKLIELSKMSNTLVVLMDLFLSCSGPEGLAGVLFQRAELDQCLKPSVMISANKITSSLGSNVLLRCDTTGYPTPNLFWTKSNGSLVTNTDRVVQESPGEGVRWSIISLNGISYKDAGDYVCKAKNVAGNAEATITVSVVGLVSTTSTPLKAVLVTSPPIALTSLPTITTTTSTTTSTTTPPPTPLKKTANQQVGSAKSTKILQGGGGKKLAADEKSTKKEPWKSVKNLNVVEETTDSAVLLWTADGLPGDTPLTVVYSADEEEEKRTLDTVAKSGKVLLEGLTPGLRYTVCLVAKGSSTGKDPCTEFYTLEVFEDEGQNKVLMIVSGFACAVALPLIILLVYKILALYCKRSDTILEDDELQKESYVKFETLTLKQRNALPNEHWMRRQTQDSERMLLCSRSSIDSQMTYKSDSSRSEFLC